MASDRARGVAIYRQATGYVGLFLFPATFVLIMFSRDLLRIWLGQDFAANSTPILQILSLGALVAGFAFIPYTLIQGSGRADITGKLHLLELTFYLVAAWYLTVHYGIIGTAIAWLLRIVCDCVILYLIADDVIGTRNGILWPILASIGAGAAAIMLCALSSSLMLKLLFTSCALAFSTVAWRWLSVQQRVPGGSAESNFQE